VLIAVGCAPSPAAPTPWDWGLPEGVPLPWIPEDNEVTIEKVELGRHLFYDRRLSANGFQSCADCHDPSRAFSDGLANPQGSTGDVVPRSSMALTNVGYRATLTWANPVLVTLEEQALVPLFGDHPLELGAGTAWPEIQARFAADPIYVELFGAAFPEQGNPTRAGVEPWHVTYALASFQRTLVSFDSPYDRWTRGDDDAIGDAAKRGMTLFFDERGECYHCHSGTDLTNGIRFEGDPIGTSEFANTGLYDIDGSGGYPAPNLGLIEFTGEPADMGKFRVPTLRNVALTAPFMHDGTIPTLRDVVETYRAGGRNVTEGPYAGDGRMNPHKSPFVFQLPLADDDVDDIIAFLETLTDESFVTDERFSNPW
jgi:cytochrome c peroxidase